MGLRRCKTKLRVFQHVFHEKWLGIEQHIGTDIQLTALGLRAGREILASSAGDGALHLAVIQAEGGGFEDARRLLLHRPPCDALPAFGLCHR